MVYLFMAYLFVVCEPLAGKRHVHVSDRRTYQDFARVILHLVDVLHPNAEKIILVLPQPVAICRPILAQGAFCAVRCCPAISAYCSVRRSFSTSYK